MVSIYITNTNNMNETVSIIIPTWNNYQYLSSCLNSLLSVSFVSGLAKIYVVNNGHKDSCDFIPKDHPQITVLQAGKNLGWEGGLKLGLEHSKGEFVMFLNDDTFVPLGSHHWIMKMLNHFNDKRIGAVGPASNVVMGAQNIFATSEPHVKYVNYLIGFCVMFKRSILEEIGGVDDTLPGGDDLDYSIRLRDKGYRLVADRTIFVFHHGFKTGERIHGASEKPFGWNSPEFTDRTNNGIIHKHGFRKWFDTLYKTPKYQDTEKPIGDREGDAIRDIVTTSGADIIYDLGCGATKTVPFAIGVDMIPKGQEIDTLNHVKSVADITADVSKPLPVKVAADMIIARHIIEHMLDPIDAIRNWMDALKSKGLLVIATPNEDYFQSMIANIEHKHTWNPQAFASMVKAMGYRVHEEINPENGISFITVIEKP